MTEHPFSIRLSEAELATLRTCVRHHENLLRGGRIWLKADEGDLSEVDRAIADTRNLKHRLFRLKPGGPPSLVHAPGDTP